MERCANEEDINLFENRKDGDDIIKTAPWERYANEEDINFFKNLKVGENNYEAAPWEKCGNKKDIIYCKNSEDAEHKYKGKNCSIEAHRGGGSSRRKTKSSLKELSPLDATRTTERTRKTSKSMNISSRQPGDSQWKT